MSIDGLVKVRCKTCNMVFGAITLSSAQAMLRRHQALSITSHIKKFRAKEKK